MAWIVFLFVIYVQARTGSPSESVSDGSSLYAAENEEHESDADNNPVSTFAPSLLTYLSDDGFVNFCMHIRFNKEFVFSVEVICDEDVCNLDVYYNCRNF